MRNNLLTYHKDEIKVPALVKTVDALAPWGFLVIGSHEKMPAQIAGVKCLEEVRQVFQKEH